MHKVERSDTGIRLQVNGEWHDFDQVIFACHSDQALAILGEQASNAELEVLGDMAYQENEVVLHTDTQLLPKRKLAWASWNYHLKGGADQETRLPTLTYNMNILQHIQSEHTFCVSLNNSSMISSDKILRSFNYHHPVFTRASIAAQKKAGLVQGKQGTWFCGAYWRNGFHEDGVVSALEVVKGIQASQPAAAPFEQKGAA